MPLIPLHFTESNIPLEPELQRLPLSRFGNAALVDTISLVLTGKTQGYLEACGCKFNMSGGITRRARLINQIRERRPNVLVLDAGNAFPTEQDVPYMDNLTSAEIDAYLEAMRLMGYRFAAINEYELYYGGEFLKSKVESTGFPFLGANVFHGGKLIAAPAVSVRVAGYRIGFVGILEPQARFEPGRFGDNTSDIVVGDPITAVRQYLPGIIGDNDYAGVIGGFSKDLVYKLVQEFPELDLVINTGPHFNITEDILNGKVVLKKDVLYGFLQNTLVLYAEGGVYGLHHVDIGVDQKGQLGKVDINYFEVERRIEEDEEMRVFLNRFYSDMASRESLVSGQVEPLFRWDDVHDRGSYVGTNKCATCHVGQHRQWSATGHSTAYKTLLAVHRQYAPKCVKCHVVGLGRSSGFDILEPSMDLANVQCEVCHGPGEHHAQSPSRANIRRSPSEETCTECHNPEHDDDFDYLRDWRIVSH